MVRKRPGGHSPPGGRERVVSTIRIWHRLRSFTGHGTITWLHETGKGAGIGGVVFLMILSTPHDVSPPCFTGRAEGYCNPMRPQVADSGTAFRNGKGIVCQGVLPFLEVSCEINRSDDCG